MIIRLFLTLALFLVPMSVSAAGLGGNYSQGCRLGQVTKFSVKGYFNKSGEGEMMIGNAGGAFRTPAQGDSEGKVLNPWKFSAEKNMWDQVRTYLGEYAVVCYDQSRMANKLKQSTDYTITSVTAPTREEPYLDNCSIAKPKTSWHDGGTRIGRIAKASFKGNVGKSFEVIVQQGESGSNFIEMSLSDEFMYDCAMRALKSGKKVRIDYVEYVWSARRDTNYDIYAISVVSEGL